MPKKLTTNDWIEKSILVHGHLYDYSQVIYTNARTKVTILCKLHGPFDQRPCDHLNSAQGCPKCQHNTPRNENEFLETCKKKHRNRYDYSNVVFKGIKHNITITCRIHGDFTQKAEVHARGNGCNKCANRRRYYKSSKSEQLWLDSIGIPNDKQHRQVVIDCGCRSYVADGFDPKTKTIYEYNGDYWHGNPAVYAPDEINTVVSKTFGQLYQETMTKKEELEKSGYNVVSIWECEHKEQIKNQTS